MKYYGGVYLDADKVRNLFLGLGKSKAEFADNAKCCESHVNNAMNPNHCAKHSFKLSTALNIAKALNVPASTIVVKEKPQFFRMDKLPDSECGALLNNWLNYTGMSQSRLCSESGVSIDAIKRIKRGLTKQPRQTTVEDIAKGFGISYEEFMAGPPDKITEQTPQEIALPYDTEIDEPADDVSTPESKCDVIQEEPVQEVVEVTAAADAMPEWLETILREEIADAHAGFKAATKAADKKCYASIVLMHAALYTRSGSH